MLLCYLIHVFQLLNKHTLYFNNVEVVFHILSFILEKGMRAFSNGIWIEKDIINEASTQIHEESWKKIFRTM